EQAQPFTGHRIFVTGETGDIGFRARKVRDNAVDDRVLQGHEYDRNPLCRIPQRQCRGRHACQDNLGRQRDEVARIALLALNIQSGPAHIKMKVAALNPTEVGKALPERLNSHLPLLLVLDEPQQPPDSPQAAVLPPRHDRPRRRAPEPRDEFSPSDHSITPSAVSRIDCGTVSPSVLAVLRFTTISYFTGNWTGRSP